MFHYKIVHIINLSTFRRSAQSDLGGGRTARDLRKKRFSWRLGHLWQQRTSGAFYSQKETKIREGVRMFSLLQGPVRVDLTLASATL